MVPMKMGDPVKVQLKALAVQDDTTSPSFKNVEVVFSLYGEKGEHGQLPTRVVVRPGESLDLGKVQKQAWSLLQEVLRDLHHQAEEALIGA